MTGAVPCPWAPADDPIYRAYHDLEWGVPERDDRALYEKLVLDGFQAGLSWKTILYKRENFRRAFDSFDPEKIARYTPKKIDRLLDDASIIRSRAKIEAAVTGARLFHEIMETRADGFSGWLWGFVGGEPIINRWRSCYDAPTRSPESEAMAAELKKRGFKFCGPVILYAFMQATGMVNDHEIACPRHRDVQSAKSR